MILQRYLVKNNKTFYSSGLAQVVTSRRFSHKQGSRNFSVHGHAQLLGSHRLPPR